MKKRLILILMAVLTVMTLGSCLVVSPPPADTELPNDGLVFSKSRGVSLVITDDGADAVVTTIYTEIYNGIFDLGIEVKRITDVVEQKGSEIAIGSTNRAASALALEKISGADPNGVAYSICYKDGVLAIVAVNEFSYAEAMKVYASLISGGELKVNADYSCFVNKTMQQFYDELYAASRAEAMNRFEHRFDEVADLLPKNGVNALRALYDLYDEDVVHWMAGLWDDATGAFYYSNSALVYAGFAPDLESTRQALAIIKNTGFIDGYKLDDDANAALRAALPDEMETKIVAWVQSLQSDEDGYFYHPQWSNVTDARRGRDLDWAIELFDMLKAKPLYPTALDRLSGAKPTSSVVKAVAKVVAAQGLPSHLQSEEAFIAYLDTFDIKANSHGTSHTIASQSSQIKAAGLIDVACDYFDNIQEEIRAEQIEKGLPLNGLWQLETNVTSVTGLYKLGGIYNTADRVIKYSDDQIKACIECILSYTTDDEGLSDIIYVFNPWAAMNVAFNSIRRSIGAEDSLYTEADLNDGYALVRENAEEMIAIAAGNLYVFKKPDGGFSYYRDYSSPTTQGASVSMGLAEGDYNATNIAIHSIPGMITNCLGVAAIPRFNSEDLDALLEMIGEAGEISKIELELERNDDFEGLTEGDIPLGYSGFTSVNVPTAQNPDNVSLHLASAAGQSGVSAGIKLGFGNSFGAAFFEMDMMVPEGISGSTHQIYLRGDSSSKNMYMITVSVSGGKVSISDASTNEGGALTTNMGISFPVGEWHKLRWEVYSFGVEAEDPSIKVKVFLDDVFVGISENHFGKHNDDPANVYMERVHFFCLKNPASEIYIDNVYSDVLEDTEWSEEGYSPIVPNGLDRVEIDFDENDSYYYSKLGYTNSKMEVVQAPGAGDGNALKLTKTDSTTAGASDTYGFYAPDVKAEGFVFSTDIYIASGSTGKYQLCLGSFGSKSVYMLTITLGSGGFTIGDEWNTGGASVSNGTATAFGEYYSYDEWHTLSLELILTDDPDEFEVTVTMDSDEFISDNYYNKDKVEGAPPATNIPVVEIRPTKATIAELYFDNIYMEFYE